MKLPFADVYLFYKENPAYVLQVPMHFGAAIAKKFTITLKL